MHCINVYLAKKSEIEGLNGLKFRELEQGIVAITEPIDGLFENRLIAAISTDYFGGAGSQSAMVMSNDNVILEKDSEEYPRSSPINEALQMLGVKRNEGMDEFDSIGLGNFRTNSDFFPEELVVEKTDNFFEDMHQETNEKRYDVKQMYNLAFDVFMSSVNHLDQLNEIVKRHTEKK